MSALWICWLLGLAWAQACVGQRADATQPNIVFILTDDQDVTLGGLEPMTKLKALIREQGVFFDNAFVHTPICCPSRSSYLTGNYIHNHGALNNTVQGNCAAADWQANAEQHTYATHLKKAGYTTGYFGKYLNQYGLKDAGGPTHIPPGWDQWFGLVGNSRYYNYNVSNNGVSEHHGSDYGADYFTDLIKNNSVKFLKQTMKQSPSSPFLMVAATPAPHGPFTPAPQYAHVYDGKTAPRTPNWNHHSEDKHWLVRTTSVMDERHINTSDNIFQHRWETLMSVDDLVSEIMMTLEEGNVLDNTYVIFSSDHGFQLGQFCIPGDKREPYEHDIRIPLMVRGPRIPKNVTVHQIALNVDIAPTIVALSGQQAPQEMDGRSLAPLLLPSESTEAPAWRDDFLIDYHGQGNPPCGLSNCPPPPLSNFHMTDASNNTYTCLRTLSSVEDTIYCEFTLTGYVEFYDLNQDPWQLTNTAHSASPSLIAKQKARLQQLRECSGPSCRT